MATNQPTTRRRVIIDRGTPYTIEESTGSPEPFPLDHPLKASALVLKWLVWALYLGCRFQSLPALGLFTSAQALSNWLVFMGEACAFLPPFLSQCDIALYLLYGRRGSRRATARLLGDFAPTIDVFVTSCGEDVDLIMDTLAAAASQDYPPHRYRVFVLDDAQDRALARAVASFNSRQAKAGTAHVTYLSREKIPGKPHYFKAGNLQFGISESRKTGLTSELVAGLDVDAIAEPDWLRRTVPHLILDGNLALVNPVQAPYNLPENDVLGQGLAASGGWLDDLRGNMGLSSCYGSGYVMRRSALDNIGGWPRVSVGEDIMCGFLLTGNGWGIAACSDVLQHDLTPGSLDALVKQRMRWMDGDLNLVKTFGFFLPGLDPCTRRTRVQRISAVINSLRLFRAVTDSLFPLIIASLICTPRGLGDAAIGDLGLRSVLLCGFLMDKLSSFWVFGALSGLTNSELWLSPCKLLAVARFYLSSQDSIFQPTSTVVSAVNERSLRHRRPLSERLLTSQALLSLLYTSVATISFVSSLGLFNHHLRSAGGVHPSCYSTGPLVWILECIVKMSMPLRYMIWPPAMPKRQDLLEEDELGVRRPKRMPSRSLRGEVAVPWLDVIQLITVLYNDWL